MSRLDQLTRLLAADPADADVPYMIALEHAKAGDFDAALHWLDKTLQVNPHYCYAFFQKAKMHLEKGEEERARQVLEEGMRTAQQAGDAHAHSELMALLESIEG